MEQQPVGTTKAQEWKVFLPLTAVLAPIFAVATVGGYGFAGECSN